MSPLQIEITQIVKDHGKPVLPKVLAEMIGRSHIQTCAILKAALSDKALVRVATKGIGGRTQYEYSAPRSVKVFGMDIRIN